MKNGNKDDEFVVMTVKWLSLEDNLVEKGSRGYYQVAQNDMSHSLHWVVDRTVWKSELLLRR